jgi:hypothetical protein
LTDDFLYNWSTPEFPYQIAQHPEHPFGFVITVHRTHILAIKVAKEEFEFRSVRLQGVKLSYLEASETRGFLEEELYNLWQEHSLIPPTSISKALRWQARRLVPRQEPLIHPRKEKSSALYLWPPTCNTCSGCSLLLLPETLPVVQWLLQDSTTCFTGSACCLEVMQF